ncbi:hypothetical protein [Photobacterium damselae]|uniref:hypothetical protein n=1 Tax=Photobacterium damselae TaxID=38293 RepID=UPI00220097DD|nr:hypothetical protein [Photobacterium damselae]BDR36497.1 hypothetical protein PDY_35450 [Photobacterium damselae subsp. damselae]
MSYFVTITFDIKNAKPSHYQNIQDDLMNINFDNYIQGKKSYPTELPNNTFVAEFDTDNFDNSAELRKWLKVEIKNIFKNNKVKGKFFIAVGQSWAWSIGHL